MADTTTRMKILLSPAWDHNFLLGPARWTSGTPYGHVDQGGQDNYHPRPTHGISETGDPWWPDESNINDPAGRFCWDADTRIISNSAFRFGGRVGNQFQPGFEATETKNRFRGTGTPMTAFDADDVTYINKISKEQQDTNVDAFEVKRSLPSHYQDYVHDAILQNSDPSDPTSALHKIYPNKPGTTPLGSGIGGYGVYQSGKGGQYSGHWVAGGYSHGSTTGASPAAYHGSHLGSLGKTDPEPYTYAYEYTLNVESLTHTWNTLSSLIPLPGLAAGVDAKVWPDLAQITQLGIDIGAMREIITVKGVIYDGPKYSDIDDGSSTKARGDPYAAPNETPIRKQQLLDIIRSQWAPLSGILDGYSGIGNPNRFPALTIGPMHTLNPNGDKGRTFSTTPELRVEKSFPELTNKGYSHPDQTPVKLKSLDMWRYGEEPSDDIRGSNLFCDDKSASFISEVWDYKFNYKGRRRYRGLLSRVSVDIQGGSPDVWDFSFDFLVFKNETTYRKPTKVEEAVPEQKSWWRRLNPFN